MSYHHLNTFERTRIEVLSKMGYSIRQIARELNRHHSTIARELKLSPRTVQRAVRDLEKVGLVTRQARYRENGSYTSNKYFLHKRV